MRLMLQANQYWRQPFEPVLNSRQLVDFVVLDVEVTGQPDGRFVLADVQVCRALCLFKMPIFCCCQAA